MKAVGASSKTESPHFPHASLYYGDGSAEDKHHVVASLMDARAVDISNNGTVEVSHLGPEGVQFDAVWIVNIGGKNPSDWKVLHKEPLVAGTANGNGIKEGDGASSTVVASEPSAVNNSNGGSKLADAASPTTESAPAIPVRAPSQSGTCLSSLTRSLFHSHLHFTFPSTGSDIIYLHLYFCVGY